MKLQVQVFRDDGGPRLAAAIELISPSNKDRLAHRRAFAMKCGSLLHQSVGVLIIDVVTNRHANLHREICELLGVHHPTSDDNALYAASYQTIVNGKMQFNTWVEDFAIGDELPELPLWLDCDLALPIRLQGSYRQTCRTLLIGERPK